MFGGIGCLWLLGLVIFFVAAIVVAADFMWRRRHRLPFTSAQGLTMQLRLIGFIGVVLGAVVFAVGCRITFGY